MRVHFAHCSPACLAQIVGLYKADKFTLVQQVGRRHLISLSAHCVNLFTLFSQCVVVAQALKDPKYLERASGLAQLHEAACDVDFPEWSSEEEVLEPESAADGV